MPDSNITCVEARHINGGTVNALRMTPAEWDTLQRSYAMGELLMPCCKGAAVPKVSPNGHPFFAHASGACSESEESQWHQAAKHTVRATLEALGCAATLEASGMGALGRWQADVWGEREDVRLAVEIQHSYQHLRDYRDRQAKYRGAGVRCLWLLRHDRLITLMKSMRNELYREGGLVQGHGGFDPQVPVTGLGLDEAGEARVLGGWPLVSATLADVLEGVLTERFICVDGWWTLDTADVMRERIRATEERAAAAMASMPKKRRR